ncbi:MAG: AraC family transcriptional regulator [Gemmatimonadota bacterium]|nr:AraC family transcriptional regulator [Gemmatimonadota bacterium]
MLQINHNRYSPGLTQSRHAHDETTVSFVLAGSLYERVGSMAVVARPFSIVIKPRDTEHSNQFAHAVRMLQIVIPTAEVAQYASWERGLGRWHWQHGGPSVRAFLTLFRYLQPSSDVALTNDRVQAAALDALTAVGAIIGSIPSGDPPGWLAVVREEIDDALETLSVSRLAAAAQVHPVYLARQFRRWYGCSMTDYQRRRRAQHAADTITRCPGSLGRASHEAGFADHAHMCRVFRAETGMTPGEFRAASEA